MIRHVATAIEVSQGTRRVAMWRRAANWSVKQQQAHKYIINARLTGRLQSSNFTRQNP